MHDAAPAPNPLIWSICRRYPLDAAGAVDTAQSIWLKLVDHLGSLGDPAALPAWLATTTRRECRRIPRATLGDYRESESRLFQVLDMLSGDIGPAAR